jgi:hypothetical protein
MSRYLRCNISADSNENHFKLHLCYQAIYGATPVVHPITFKVHFHKCWYYSLMHKGACPCMSITDNLDKKSLCNHLIRNLYCILLTALIVTSHYWDTAITCKVSDTYKSSFCKWLQCKYNFCTEQYYKIYSWFKG